LVKSAADRVVRLLPVAKKTAAKEKITATGIDTERQFLIFITIPISDGGLQPPPTLSLNARPNQCDPNTQMTAQLIENNGGKVNGYPSTCTRFDAAGVRFCASDGKIRPPQSAGINQSWLRRKLRAAVNGDSTNLW
jgi:hypothetical protein